MSRQRKFNDYRTEGPVTFLLLTQRGGKTSEAIIDTKDLPYLQALGKRWVRCKHRSNSGGYVTLSGGNTKLHRLLIGMVATVVDHINGNGLDNRRANLRPASNRQNLGNGRLNRNSTTGFKGVSLDRSCGKYRVRANIIDAAGKTTQAHIGLFNCPIEAARAYDAVARKQYGEFALLNFPGEVAV